MATVASTGDGLASSVIPTFANGDTININHNVIWDIDNSAMTNGILNVVVAANKVLSVKPDAVSHLKFSGRISGSGDFLIAGVVFATGWTLTSGQSKTYQINRTIPIQMVKEGMGRYGTYWEKTSIADVELTQGSYYHDTVNGVLYIHDSDDSDPSTKTIMVLEPINRPITGSTVRFTMTYTGIDITLVSASIFICGWIPNTPNHSYLDKDYPAGTTEIGLINNVDLQQGEKVVIGQINLQGQITETNKGLYSISNYNSDTKKITLSTPLLSDRLAGDVVAIYSRPIDVIQTVKPSSVFSGWWLGNAQGCRFKQSMPGLAPRVSQKTKYLTFDTATPLFYNISGGPIENTTVFQSSSSNAQFSKYGVGGTIKDSVVVGGIVVFNASSEIVATDCVIQNIGTEYSVFYHSNAITLVNCKIKGVVMLGNNAMGCKMINCIVENSNEAMTTYSTPKALIESFNHNGIENNYKSWGSGGTVESELVDNVPQSGKLIFKPVSATNPILHDYSILAPANRVAKFLISLTKDTAGIISKLQIIDPSNDPLIDSTAAPLAESTAQNNTDNQQLGIAYKSTTPKQLILRILCQNASGNVVVDTTRIDQALAKRIQ